MNEFRRKVEILFLGALTTYAKGIKKGQKPDELKIEIAKQFTDALMSFVPEENKQK